MLIYLEEGSSQKRDFTKVERKERAVWVSSWGQVFEDRGLITIYKGRD